MLQFILGNSTTDKIHHPPSDDGAIPQDGIVQCLSLTLPARKTPGGNDNNHSDQVANLSAPTSDHATANSRVMTHANLQQASNGGANDGGDDLGEALCQYPQCQNYPLAGRWYCADHADNVASMDELKKSFAELKKSFAELKRSLEQLKNTTEEIEIHQMVKVARIESDMSNQFKILENSNGQLIWKIEGYGERKQDAILQKALSLYSSPFMTSSHGYKMCARVYLNGDGMGKGTHLSFFFVVMKGEYDSLLPWPFRQKVTLMILDQGPDRRHLSETFRPDPTSSSFKKPISDMNIASGCPLFIAHTVLDGSTYVKDDTIILKIIIDTNGLENH